jgi:hypothetical protein
MKLGRRAAAFVVAAAALVGSRLGAQSVTLTISNLVSDSTSPAPNMTVTGFATRPEFGPYSVSLALSLDPQFRSPFYARSAPGETATFTIDSLLSEHAVVFFRARLIDQFGTIVAEASARHPVRGWIRLIAPLRGPTTIVDSTRTPKFVWSSPPITFPPGLWTYQISIIETQSGTVAASSPPTTDTAFTPPAPLHANTSYRWEVDARAANSTGSGAVRALSPGTFVISSDSAPTVTLFYQSFPNPFGRGTRSDKSTIWFDLARSAKVRITVYDIRQRMVRRLIPGLLADETLPAGAYGRDGTVTWDGKDDAGRFVPPGLYIAVFEGDGTRASIKMLFKGP